MDVRSAVQNQIMAQLGDDDFDEGVETFWRLFAANLGEIAKQKTITLWFPRVEFTGGSAAGYDFDITGWRGSIAMHVEADGVADGLSSDDTYIEVLSGDTHHAAHFRLQVGDAAVNGIFFVLLDADGKIADVSILYRTLPSGIALQRNIADAIGMPRWELHTNPDSTVHRARILVVVTRCPAT